MIRIAEDYSNTVNATQKIKIIPRYYKAANVSRKLKMFSLVLFKENKAEYTTGGDGIPAFKLKCLTFP